MKDLIKILLLSLAFTPLIYDSSVFFPDSAGKIFFARSVVFAASVLISAYFIFAKDFRNEAANKLGMIFRNSSAISIFLFFTAFIISAVFAVDKYGAFWGDVQRGEGVAGMSFFVVFYVLALLIFERKDWQLFFKLSLLTAGVLLLRQFFQFFSGVERPGSYIGNPTFLAGYLIFSIFSAIQVFKENNGKFWKYSSMGIIFFSIGGIFITETRGALLGLAFGFIAALLYYIFRGVDIAYKNISLKKASIFFLCLLAVFAMVFVGTRKSAFWQNVPGLARVATISSEDISTRTRLFSIKTSLDAIDPGQNGWSKLAVGWGPNNFIQAFGTHYDPEQFKYEIEWFDRAHNKLLDVLVMNGIFGLALYLALWFFYFRQTVSKREFSMENLGLLFYGVAFFIHLMFVFDHVATSLPLFAVFAFVAGRQIHNPGLKVKNIYPAGSILIFTTLFLGYVFLRGDLGAYSQMKNYLALKKEGGSEMTAAKVKAALEPFTIAQTDIRRDLLTDYFKDRAISGDQAELWNEAIQAGEAYISKRPTDFRFLFDLAGAYTNKGGEENNDEYILKGEKYFRQTLFYVPDRPDFNYALALNLTLQDRHEESLKILQDVIEKDKALGDSYFYYGFILSLQGENKYAEALDYFEKSFEIKPHLYAKNRGDVEGVYGNYIKYFYNLRDKERFIRSANRLIENNNPQSDSLRKILQYINERGVWPNVKFN